MFMSCYAAVVVCCALDYRHILCHDSRYRRSVFAQSMNDPQCVYWEVNVFAVVIVIPSCHILVFLNIVWSCVVMWMSDCVD